MNKNSILLLLLFLFSWFQSTQAQTRFDCQSTRFTSLSRTRILQNEKILCDTVYLYTKAGQNQILNNKLRIAISQNQLDSMSGSFDLLEQTHRDIENRMQEHTENMTNIIKEKNGQIAKLQTNAADSQKVADKAISKGKKLRNWLMASGAANVALNILLIL